MTPPSGACTTSRQPSSRAMRAMASTTRTAALLNSVDVGEVELDPAGAAVAGLEQPDAQLLGAGLVDRAADARPPAGSRRGRR